MNKCTAEVAALLAQVDDLIVQVKQAAAVEADSGAGSPEEALRIIVRYRDELAAAPTPISASALRACNLLTTVNKGLADSAWTASHPQIGPLAHQVMQHAVAAAECIRADQ